MFIRPGYIKIVSCGVMAPHPFYKAFKAFNRRLLLEFQWVFRLIRHRSVSCFGKPQ